MPGQYYPIFYMFIYLIVSRIFSFEKILQQLFCNSLNYPNSPNRFITTNNHQSGSSQMNSLPSQNDPKRPYKSQHYHWMQKNTKFPAKPILDAYRTFVMVFPVLFANACAQFISFQINSPRGSWVLAHKSTRTTFGARKGFISFCLQNKLQNISSVGGILAKMTAIYDRAKHIMRSELERLEI